MLSATLYKFRRGLLKQPWKILVGLVVLAVIVFFIAVPSMTDDGTGVVRNQALIIGASSLIFMVMFNYMFYSGYKNGAVGFSTADVNFFMAGPFTEKFNLILAALNILTVGAVFAFILAFQSSTLNMAIGTNSFDMIAIIIGSFAVIVIAYFLGAFFCTHFDEQKEKKRIAIFTLIGLDVLFVIMSVVSLLKEFGSFAGIKAQGARAVIAHIGNTVYAKIFPVGGWMRLIYEGILTGDTVYLTLGIILIVSVILLIVVLFASFDINYYETAIANAQKAADLLAAKRAGVDSDSAKLSQKIKVGKETLTSGSGASVFFSRHLLENKRATKFFFVNALAILYRLICAVYIFIFSRVQFSDEGGNGTPIVIAGLMMMLILDVPIYGGGKTILEFNKPYIFLSPQEGWKKLMYCLMADLPEMIFDSAVCSALLYMFAGITVAEAVSAFVMFVGFAYLCEIVGLMMLRMFKGFGRYLLMFLRSLVIYVFMVAVVIPSLIISLLAKEEGYMLFMLSCAGISIILSLILLLISRNMVDKVEYAG